MNNIYKQKAEKYEYKYLKLIRELEGGFLKACQQQTLNEAVAALKKGDSSLYNIYKEKCTSKIINDNNAAAKLQYKADYTRIAQNMIDEANLENKKVQKEMEEINKKAEIDYQEARQNIQNKIQQNAEQNNAEQMQVQQPGRAEAGQQMQQPMQQQVGQYGPSPGQFGQPPGQFGQPPGQYGPPPGVVQAGQFGQPPGVAQAGQFGQPPGVAQAGQFGQPPGQYGPQPGQYGPPPGVAQAGQFGQQMFMQQGGWRQQQQQAAPFWVQQYEQHY
jgi:hypothetical protein